MDDIVKVIEKKDDSVQKIIERTGKDLQRKYNKKRKINEKLLKKKSPLQKVFSIIFDVLLGIFLVFSGILCFSTINCQFQNVPPMFAGFTNFQVQTTSMVASGLNKLDNFIARTVNTKSLSVGDIIVFYPYSKSNKEYYEKYYGKCRKVEEQNEIQFTFEFKSLLGFQTEEIKEAAKEGCVPVVHHIYEIYEAADGRRWFKTKGSSNAVEDSWIFSEDMILGAYDNSSTAKVISKILAAFSSQYGVLLLIGPIFIFASIIILECLKDVQLAFLELDCVEEKRKITDEICVKNDVGFNMDTKTKYKILAQASDDERATYISLLWREGKAPDAIKKYIHRKKILYKFNKRMLDLNRECEKMYKDGVSSEEIAKIYLAKKAKIQEQERAETKRLKQISKVINEKKRMLNTLDDMEKRLQTTQQD